MASEILIKWKVPPINFSDEGYVLIFASGKDKTDLNDDLHTNFRLESSGGYLALVKPDGITIASEFIEYPEQFEDVSYGEGYAEPTEIFLLREGKPRTLVAPTGILVPVRASDAWTSGADASSALSAGSYRARRR